MPEFPSLSFPVTSTIVDTSIMDFIFPLNNVATTPPPQLQSPTQVYNLTALGIMLSGLVFLSSTPMSSVNIFSMPNLSIPFTVGQIGTRGKPLATRKLPN